MLGTVFEAAAAGIERGEPAAQVGASRARRALGRSGAASSLSAKKGRRSRSLLFVVLMSEAMQAQFRGRNRFRQAARRESDL